ncbi:UDP-N-acetylmuramate dehydrogenase [Peptoniphilus asaccharolyticus DSM 20463]|uniref:UDP-N-acetylenolpyruvoylglucosamine reductase n=1 Tax=Peptoniphilus asaccharolyticus DSM 20463 TaxID=573058 RepID=A0A1W1UID6_PEPAS|nr:UDP-N-acetylmuramate dehydrogenase [Peptoniphilus asaccharolyticus]MBL7574738.1 UDP-N-acetylmuramate dehydrogenase [Peptoniphilus asaccharolyticus]SMB80591.1 UDP-N-acetylmuramate dehydrogenase [Peptoniphilus asaccharolyticus DSM 20463]
MNSFENFGSFYREENLDKYTTFKIGGPAEFLLIPKDENSLVEAIKTAKQKNMKITLLGNGSNVLIDDSGVEGLVIVLRDTLNDIDVRENTVIAGAGATLRDTAIFAAEHSLGGMEFAHGIPGSVGGGAIMNAGAYDGELKDVVKKVRLIDSNLEIIELSNKEMQFGYRDSIAQMNNYIILSVEFELFNKNKEEIFAKMDELMQRRIDKQPLEMPSSGSTFRRPTGYFAGKLIQDSGLQGLRVGGAMISTKHSGFVVNFDNATSQNVKDLISTVQKIVMEKFGVELKREVKYIGGR